MSTKITKRLDTLVDMCLSEDTYQEYNDTDLMNATIVFSHILLDVIYAKNCDKLSFEDMATLAETAGKAIRELVSMTTDKDLHDIIRAYQK